MAKNNIALGVGIFQSIPEITNIEKVSEWNAKPKELLVAQMRFLS